MKFRIITWLMIFSTILVGRSQEVELRVQRGHLGHINNVVFSPDGKVIATQGTEKIKLWDVRTGRLLREMDSGKGSMSNGIFQFSADGAYLYSQNANKTRSWEVLTGKSQTRKIGFNGRDEIIEFPAKNPTKMSLEWGGRMENAIYAEVISKYIGRTVNGVRQDASKPEAYTYRKFGIFNIDEENGPIEEPIIVGSYEDSSRRYEKIILSEAGDKAATVVYLEKDQKREIEIWKIDIVDSESPKRIRSIPYPENKKEVKIKELQFGQDNQLLAVSDSESNLYVWHINSGKLVLNQNQSSSDFKIKFTPRQKELAVLDNALSFISLTDGKVISRIELPDPANSMDFSSLGEEVAVSLGKEGLQVYNVKTGGLKWTVEKATSIIKDKVISKDNRYMAVANYNDPYIKIWDLETGLLLKKLKGEIDQINSIAFSTVGHLLAIGGSTNYRGLVEVWNIDKKEIISTFAGHTKSVTKVSFHPDKFLVASSGYDDAIYLWNARSGAIKQKFTGHEKRKEAISVLEFSIDGKYLISGSANVKIGRGRSFKCWSIEAGEELHDFGKLKRGVRSIDMLPDSSGVMVAQGTGISIYDIKTGLRKEKIKQFSNSYSIVKLDPSGKYLAGAAENTNVKLLDAKTGKRIRTIFSSGETLSFFKKGKYLITGDQGHQATFWDVETGRKILSFLMFEEGRAWVAIDSTGRFDANEAGLQYIHYVNGLDVIGLTQVRERYYEPGIIAKHIGERDEPLRKVKPLKEDDLGPIVDIKLKENILNIQLKLRKGGLGRVGLYINYKEVDQDINPDKSLNTTVDLSKYTKYFIAGESFTVGVLAFSNDNQIESAFESVKYRAPLLDKVDVKEQAEISTIGEAQRLFALIIGTSNYSGDPFDLSFADKDAEKMAEAIKSSAEAFLEEEKLVEVKLLSTALSTEQWPSKENIRKSMQDYAKRLTPSDVFVLYLSGHGNTSDKDGGDYFYYLTHHMTSGNLSDEQIRKKYAISTKEFQSWLSEIPAQKQVMILDACASGKLAEGFSSKNMSASQERALERLKTRTGLFIISGSTGDRNSFEHPSLGQGLLTYSLLSGIKYGEGLRDDEYVDVMSLFTYAKENVPIIVAEIGKPDANQNPTIFAPYGAESFDIGKATRQVKENINISTESKILFTRTRLGNSNKSNLDNLGLEEIIHKQMINLNYEGDKSPIIYRPDAPGAYQITGKYRVENSIVVVEASLVKAKANSIEIIGTINVKGTLDTCEKLGKEIVKKAHKLVENLP